MELIPLRLEGAYEVRLRPRKDHRGYFMRTYDASILEEHDLQTVWTQENESLSLKKHTVRGLHFQKPPHTETKLLRVVKGAILDVFVDLRKSSATFREWDSIELSAENRKMVYIPKGYAHGFCSLTPDVVVQYKVDSAYAPDSEGTIRWNDPDIGVKWPTENPVLSEKDSTAPFFADFDSPFE